MRLVAEVAMLSDMQNIQNEKGSFETRGQAGETPVKLVYLLWLQKLRIE